MADDARSADWEEVGRRFGDLGHRLQAAWSESQPDRPGGESDGARKVTAALDDLKASISHTVSDPDVRTAAASATSTFTDALAANLRQLADWIEQRPGSGTGGDVVSTDKPES